MSFVGDFQNEAKRQTKRGRCLHFDAGPACTDIVRAHSIQKQGQLRLIAEDGHVYRLSADLSTMKRNRGSPQPQWVGIQKASTFAGFCKHHDALLFDAIDNSRLEPQRREVALYAYRCLCRECFVKDNAVAVLKKARQHPDLSASSALTLRASLAGHLIGLEGVRRHKQLYDASLREGRYHDFDFTYFISKSRCSVQLSGVLYPDFDFLGQRLQNLGSRSAPFDLITFFTAPTREGWAFGFAWHASSGRSCLPLIRSLASRVASGERVEDALLRFSFSCSENHAIRISWWDNLSERGRKAALERMLLMVHPTVPVPGDYLIAGCEGLADWRFENVHTSLQAAT
jgi:hypothetical protein